MGKRECIKWKKFSYLTIIEKWEITNNKQKVLTKCICWKEKFIQLNNVLSWSTKSCWCMKWKIISEKNTIHWMWSLSWIYNSFRMMCSRCNNKSNKDYSKYWWRWIKVLWWSFDEFYKDMWDSYKEWLSIDRIDVNWNYCKENCRRADRRQQANNRRDNHKIMYKWKEYNLCQLASMFWVDHSWLYRYIKNHPNNRERHYEIKNGK